MSITCLWTTTRPDSYGPYLRVTPRLCTLIASSSDSRQHECRRRRRRRQLCPQQRHPDRTAADVRGGQTVRSEEHTSELQSLMRISYAVFCLKKKKTTKQ